MGQSSLPTRSPWAARVALYASISPPAAKRMRLGWGRGSRSQTLPTVDVGLPFEVWEPNPLPR